MTRSTSRGFTLVELMITIAVLAIGSALAYPSFTGVIRNNRVATSTNSFIAAFNLARSEAIRGNRGAGVCPSRDGISCEGTDWNVGYMAYEDVDVSGNYSAGDTVIRYFEANDAMELSAEPGQGEPAGGGGIEQVAFQRSGRVTAAVEINVQIKGCEAGKQYRRLLVVRRTGQARMENATCE
jgi:type IV fimbrial biogenesis protein FimT